MAKAGSVKILVENVTSNYNYVWKLEKNVSSLKEWALLVGQNVLGSDTITFETGILQKTKHSVKAYFIISEEELIVKVYMGNPSLYGQFTHSKISDKSVCVNLDQNAEYGKYNRDFTFISKATVEDSFGETEMTETVWQNQLGTNTDDYCTITLSLTLDHTYWLDETAKTKNVTNELTLLNESTPWTTLDTKTLYHDRLFTDFVIHCGDSNFKVHRIVLANRSPVFAAMFEQPLGEILEGKMTISDYEPKFIEEFLKFLYTGNADFENCASQLLLLSEKYCVDHLKQLSEQYSINSVNVDNVLNLYNLGELAKSKELSNKCMDIMISTRKDLFKTAEDAIAFRRDFPSVHDVIFESNLLCEYYNDFLQN